VELWARLGGVLLDLIRRYDDQAVFLLVFIEECGVPLPLPGDLVMMLAGFRVAQGKMSLVWTLFLLELATVLGSSILYWLAARGGRPLLYRYGRYIHLDQAKLDRAEAWVRRRGALAIVLGRIIPGLRIPTALAAGVFGVPYPRFLPALALGAFLYISFFVLLGMWLGPRALLAIEGPRFSIRAVLTVVWFVAIAAFVLSLYRRALPVRGLAPKEPARARKLETSALAGFLATLEMGLGVNVALYALGAIGVRVPERALLHVVDQAAARYSDGNVLRFAMLMTLVLFVGGILWAIVYSHLGARLLTGPPWLRGLLFSALPFGFSMLVMLPLLGAGPFGLALGMGPAPLLGELFRHALFGVGLGLSYSLLRLARQGPAPIGAAPEPG